MIIAAKQETPGSLRSYSVGIAIITVALIVFGLVNQYSAGISLSAKNRTAAFDRQLVYIPFALFAAWLAYRVNLDRLREYRWTIFIGALFLMLCARVPGIGVTVNGSWRWIDFGFFRLQPSDIGKIAMIICLSDLLARMQRHTMPAKFKIFQFKNQGAVFFTPKGWVDVREGFIKPVGVIATICIFIALGPDLGTIILCLAVGGLMMFISGVRWKYTIPTFILAATGLVILVMNWGSRMRRITSFMDPWGRRADEAYQLFEGMVAFGVGGITGKGAANGLQVRSYLPEAHTDFVLANIGEEHGFIGTALVACAYFGIFWLAYRAMRFSTDLYRLNICLGATLFLVLQALVNMGVVTGLLPTKGISLPFLSYGGTNLVIMSSMVGLILNCIRDASKSPFLAKEIRG
jgi:cell division protein FtsW